MVVFQRSLLCSEKIVSILLSICSVIDLRKEKKSVTDDIICDKEKKKVAHEVLQNITDVIIF